MKPTKYANITNLPNARRVAADSSSPQKQNYHSLTSNRDKQSPSLVSLQVQLIFAWVSNVHNWDFNTTFSQLLSSSITPITHQRNVNKLTRKIAHNYNTQFSDRSTKTKQNSRNSTPSKYIFQRLEFLHQKKYLELLILGPEERGGADDRKAWPPTRPPVLAAAAGSTEPSVNTPAANATSASFAKWFSFFLPLKRGRIWLIGENKRKKRRSRKGKCSITLMSDYLQLGFGCKWWEHVLLELEEFFCGVWMLMWVGWRWSYSQLEQLMTFSLFFNFDLGSAVEAEVLESNDAVLIFFSSIVVDWMPPIPTPLPGCHVVCVYIYIFSLLNFLLRSFS